MPTKFVFSDVSQYFWDNAQAQRDELDALTAEHLSETPLYPVSSAFLRNWIRTMFLATTPQFLTATPLDEPVGVEFRATHTNFDPKLIDRHHEQSGAMLSGLEGIAAAILIGAWTAFETLSTDLWIAAVNQRPHTLGHSEPKASDDVVVFQRKSILLDHIRDWDFDLREHMGDAIAYKFNFQSLKGIRHAYEKTFPDESTVNEPLKHPDLWLLSSIRNLYVHRGGIIDVTFDRNVQSNEELAVLGIGEELRPSSDLIKQLLQSAYRCSVDLLLAVDKWLINNPDRKRHD